MKMIQVSMCECWSSPSYYPNELSAQTSHQQATHLSANVSLHDQSIFGTASERVSSGSPSSKEVIKSDSSRGALSRLDSSLADQYAPEPPVYNPNSCTSSPESLHLSGQRHLLSPSDNKRLPARSYNCQTACQVSQLAHYHFNYPSNHLHYYTTATNQQPDSSDGSRTSHQQLGGNSDFYPYEYPASQPARTDHLDATLPTASSSSLGLTSGHSLANNQDYYGGSAYNQQSDYYVSTDQQHQLGYTGSRYAAPNTTTSYSYPASLAPTNSEDNQSTVSTSNSQGYCNSKVSQTPLLSNQVEPAKPTTTGNGQVAQDLPVDSATAIGRRSGSSAPGRAYERDHTQQIAQMGTSLRQSAGANQRVVTGRRNPGGSSSSGCQIMARRKNATRESTATLKDWLDEHGQNPYPTKGEKIMLSIITKMSLTQVSTWFANARRRIKKENREAASMWSHGSSSSGSHQSAAGSQASTGTASIRYFIQRHQKQLGGAAGSMLASLSGPPADGSGQSASSMLANQPSTSNNRMSLVYSCRSLALAAAATAAASRQRRVSAERVSDRRSCRSASGRSRDPVTSQGARGCRAAPAEQTHEPEPRVELASSDESCTSVETQLATPEVGADEIERRQ